MEKTVPIDRLEPHPLNANRQPPQVTRKLQANIARTGRYPSIIVRRVRDDVPYGETSFQILDGEHRWKICRALGHSHVRVDDWGPISDEDALTLLATLNPLRGRDHRRKRATILSILRKYHEADELAQILPEEAPQIDRMIERLAVPEMTDDEEQQLQDDVEPVTLLVTPEMKRVINAAARHRTAQGELPGQSIDAQRFAIPVRRRREKGINTQAIKLLIEIEDRIYQAHKLEEGGDDKHTAAAVSRVQG